MDNDTASKVVTDGILVRVTDINNVWQSLRIAASIPLGRLEWTWTGISSASLRDSSTSARASFQPTTSPRLPEPHKHPTDWYRNPFVYVYIVTIPSLETSYDTPAWSALRAFIDSCRRLTLEYIVILAASDEEVVRHKKLLDRLRQDVNPASHTRERLVIVPPAAIKEEELRPITHLHHSHAHRDLLLRLRECVRDAVNARVKGYDDHVTRSYLNRAVSEWTYGSFFVLKEGMGFVFQQLGRRDLTVKFYDELQTLFAEQPRATDSIFSDLPAADAAIGLSDPNNRDYRTRLLEGNCTELDTQTYLFARQMALLLVDHKYSDLAERGLKLITSIANRCAELAHLSETPAITPVFRDTWVFAAARIIAEALAPSIPSAKDVQASGSSQLSTSRERHAVRLVAGFHVHALRAFSGLAHIVLPSCLSPAEVVDSKKNAALAEEAKVTSHKELSDALSSNRKAEMFYSEIANSAASLYEMGGRARGAAALDGDAGIAHLRNESFRDAEALLSSQCLRFTNDHGWDELHRRQRRELAKAEKEMDRIQEYLVSCLTMLYMGRSSRFLYSPSVLSEEERASLLEDATYWIAEASTSASRLPRVMRYKADRLFHVSVLPNETAWEEGDAGAVTVRIKSDIVAPLSIDSLSIELRLSDTAGPPKSALRSREEDNPPMSPGVDSARSGAEPPSPTSSHGHTAEHVDAITLKSAKGIIIKPGTNDVGAYVKEVPVAGRYRINLISMYLGNLKIVQQPSKSPLNLVVSTKGGNRAGLNPTTSSGVTEIGACEAQFPFFFAAGRKPSASIEMGENAPLYLAPRSRQYVTVVIRALERGMAKGAILSCSLSGKESNAHPRLSGSFVRFIGGGALPSAENVSGSDNVIEVIRGQRTPSSDWDAFDLGEATIDREVQDGEDVKVKIGLDVLPDDSLSSGRQFDLEADSRQCTLRVDLSWHELQGNTRREQTNIKQIPLSFVSPVDVSAQIELNSEWGADNVSRAVGLDGTPLGEGGTLVCSVSSHVDHGEGLTIRKMALEPPSWLELRPDEEPGHTSLLPCQLRHNAMFSGAFDVFLREGVFPELPPTQGERREVFVENAAKRRLSRRPPMDSSGDIVPSTDNGRISERRRRAQEDLSDGELTPENEDSFEDARSGFSKEDGDSTETPREDEVLDLVSSSDGLTGRPSSSGPVSGNGEMESFAVLRLDVEIAGIDGVTIIARRISMEAMHANERRYGVERRMKNMGESGKIMELEFLVREIGARNGHYDGTDESGVLQYEVDADPSVWVVVGRRRGKIAVGSNGGQGSARAELVPISCGRHGVPCIRLYEHDGQAMAWSRYENVNEYMQVVVMPCRTIVSGCRVAGPEEALTPRAGNSQAGTPGVRSGMPVVIASDLFFGS